MIKKNSFLYLFILYLFLSCSLSKSFYNDGLKLEEAGMYSESVNKYYESLKLDKNNVEASIALKRVGTRLYQEDIENVFSSAKKSNHKDVVYSFLKAEEFRKKLNTVGINMNKDKNAELTFENSKDRYTKDLLPKINNLIADEKFKESEILLNEVVSLNPENQEYQDMKATVYSEPIYREGLKNLESNRYRMAYYNFEKIKNYKDSKNLMNLSQDKALFKIMIVPIKNNSSRIEITDKIYGNIFKDILANKDPFLNVLDQNQAKNILDNKGVDITEFNNSNNSKFLSMMSEIFGVQAFLKGTITDVSYKRDEPKRTVKQAFIEHKTVRRDPKTRRDVVFIEHKPVEYYEYYEYSDVTISFNFTLVSKEGKILISDVVSQTAESKVNYSQYSGDYRELLPSINDNVYNSNNFNQVKRTNNSDRFYELFKANKDMKSTVTLENEVCSKITKILADKLKQYNPEHNQ